MSPVPHYERSVSRLVEQLAILLGGRGERLALAESCTGGAIAVACTDRAGSSAWFDRGFVTYSNEAKQAMLDVDAGLIDSHGAVSVPVVEAMLRGALAHSLADWVIAVSGVAGPGGGSADKPVGTVIIGWQQRHGEPDTVGYAFEGDRGRVRQESVTAALVGLRERIDACR